MTTPAPNTALILGWGGVLPFIGAALLKAFGSPLMGVYALNLGTIYAGIIITFIGAVHWGAALSDQKPWRLIWSVLPALAVVPVLILSPPLRVPFLVIGLLICWGVDVLTIKKNNFPNWYIRLRHGLTGVACLSMVTLGAV